jgi:hypothetical protein
MDTNVFNPGVIEHNIIPKISPKVIYGSLMQSRINKTKKQKNIEKQYISKKFM